MSMLIWVLNIIVALLTAINVIAWGYAIREVGDPQITLNFLLKLLFNKWFIIAIASAFIASLTSYTVLRELGVIAGRFFLSLSIITTILAGTLVLGEKLTLREWAGIAMIIAGMLLVGEK